MRSTISYQSAMPQSPTLPVPAWAAAGAVQQTNYPAGAYHFRTAALAFRTKPNVNSAAFAAAVASNLPQTLPGAGSVSNVRVVGESSGGEYDPPGIRSVEFAGPTWWLTVEGNFTATAAWQLSMLNRAIARAVSQASHGAVTTYPALVTAGDPAFAAFRPADGSQLLGVLDNPNACAGHVASTPQMWIRGCTTVTANLPAAATLTPIQAPSTPSGTPPITALSPGANVAPCAVQIRQGAWIRPRPVFDHVGPHIPADSVLSVVGQTNQIQGAFKLFKVQVVRSALASAVGVVGYAALNAADLERQTPPNCVSRSAADSTVPPGTALVPVPGTSGAPAPSAPAPSSGGGTPSPSAMVPAPGFAPPGAAAGPSAMKYGLIAAAGVLAVGVVVIAVQEKKKGKGAKPSEGRGAA